MTGNGSYRAVAGYCPMGCGRTLIAGASGRVTCSSPRCLNPEAVHNLLAEKETEHVVVLRPTDFTVQHPLRERLDGQLLRCSVYARIAGGDGPPARRGTYRVLEEDQRLIWLAVPRG